MRQHLDVGIKLGNQFIHKENRNKGLKSRTGHKPLEIYTKWSQKGVYFYYYLLSAFSSFVFCVFRKRSGRGTRAKWWLCRTPFTGELTGSSRLVFCLNLIYYSVLKWVMGLLGLSWMKFNPNLILKKQWAFEEKRCFIFVPAAALWKIILWSINI